MNNYERVGVSQVQLITNQKLQWIFRELGIQDFGVDAHIEIMGENYATGKLIAVQIKCGESYFKESNSDFVTFRFDEKHYEYWINYSIPVIVVLVHPKSLEVIWEVVDTDTVVQVNDHSYKVIIKRENQFNAYAREKLLAISGSKRSYQVLDSSIEKCDFFQLGYNYEFGKDGYEIDYCNARHYYKLAADQGDEVAQFNYSLLLIHGKGGDVDDAQAYYYMKKSAQQGFVPAYYNLGLLFFHGKVLYKKDMQEAAVWLRKAKNSGHENASIWLMYCELYEIIHTIKTPDIGLDTIPFVDNFHNLINRVSVDHLFSVIEHDIQQSKISGWEKGLFHIAEHASENAKRQKNSEGVALWEDFQRIILLLELLSRYYNYDFASFIINIDFQQLENAWNQQQKTDGMEEEWREPLYNIACNEIKRQSPYQQFWSHVIKCCDLLCRIEKAYQASKEKDIDYSVEVLKSNCDRIGVSLQNITFHISEEWDVYIQGNIAALDGYKRLGKLAVKADLCDGAGRTLLTLESYDEIKLHLSVWDSFKLVHCYINRCVDVTRFRKIRIYPVFG